MSKTIKELWAQMRPYERDAWIAKDLFGWSVIKHLGHDAWGGRQYRGNPKGKRNKEGGLAGIRLFPVPRYSYKETDDYWIAELEKRLEKEVATEQEETP